MPQTALYLEDLFRRTGLTEDAFQTLLVGSARVEAILSDRRVAAATLTGSEGAGRAIGETAGRNLKKMVLELGGSDPFVVLPSADIAKAAEVATTARCQNNGQSCTDIHGEEVFGPVASLYRADDVEDALRIANDTDLGLGSNVWTTDESEIDMFVDGLEAGQVFVNGMTTSYPETSFGGIKDSGHGRELSAFGIREFCTVKTVWIA